MNHLDWKHVALVFTAIAASCVLALWSWNTLAGLFGAPAAEFRHVLAVIGLGAVAKILFTRRRARR